MADEAINQADERGLQDLRGKTTLVTGAARRIGRQIALALGRAGSNVVIHFHDSAAQASSLMEELEGLGVRAWTVQADLTDATQVKQLFATAVEQAGAIDILVNNASYWPTDTIWDLAEQTLRRSMQVHVVAPIVLSRDMANQRRPGHILNILDARITDYDRQHASYHMAKRTLFTLTRMFAMELAPQITVNAIAPGLILPPEGKGPDYLARLAHTNPMHKYGQPQDVVDAAMFLLTSRFITGQVIYVDGGFHMRHNLYG